jgi:hypothetical protein
MVSITTNIMPPIQIYGILKDVLTYNNSISLEFVKIKSHSGNPFNDAVIAVDTLAKSTHLPLSLFFAFLLQFFFPFLFSSMEEYTG